MGPIALFDKSFLQSLTVDESVWFDRFFYPVVCPIFYVETLADLAKTPKRSRTAESEVRIIASKFPEMSGSPCLHHSQLCQVDIMGADVPMNGRIPRGGGRQVKSGERLGHIFDQSPEDAAFQRWQAEEFYDVERMFAAQWRVALEKMGLQQIAKSLQDLGISGQTFRSLEEVKQSAQSVVTNTGKPLEGLKLAVRFFDVPQQFHGEISQRWESVGRPPLGRFAPYAAYVLTIEIFFQIALAADLISPERPSNRTDVAYLFYLPFSLLFISNDKIHERLAPLFLRADQEFVWGQELKSDLKRLNDHYQQLSNAERERGVMAFAARPPADGNFLVTEIWKRHLPPSALEKKDASNSTSPANERQLVEMSKAFKNAPNLPPEQVIADESAIDVMSIERRVSQKRGSWWQVPKDLPDDEKS